MKKLLYLLVLLPFFGHAQSIHINASDSSICIGDTVTFTAAATGTATPFYKWRINGISTGVTLAVFTTNTLNDKDTVTCLLTNSAGDTVLAISDSIVMTIDTLPDAGTITGPSEVCVGATVTFTSSVAGGTWATNTTHASVMAGYVTGMSMTYESRDSVFYIIGNSCGFDSIGTDIDVLPIPSAYFWIERTSLCVGRYAGISISEYELNELHAEFYSTNGCVSVYASGWGSSYMYAIKPGSDHLYCVEYNACGVDTFGGYNITVQPPPLSIDLLTIPSQICVDLIDSIPKSNPGYEESWTSNSNKTLLSNTNTGATIKGIRAGLDTITLRVTNSCGYIDTSAIITVNPAPREILASDLCKGFSTIIHDSTPGGTWTCNDPLVVSVNGLGVITGTNTGTAIVTYTLQTGCYATENVNVAACEEMVELFPNPAQNEVIIRQLTNVFSDYAIVNSIGQVMQTRRLQDFHTIIDIASLKPGLYIVKLFGSGGSKTIKFVKE